MRREPLFATILLGGLALFLAAGCPDNRGGGVGIRVVAADVEEALRRINDNLRRLEQKVEADATVTFRFRDQDQKLRQFVGHEATLRFVLPQCLRFDVRGLTGVIAQFGSNDDRYWVWVEPELNRLWWGSWSAVTTEAESRIPVPPQRLLDALMLRPVPTTQMNGARPALERYGNGQRVVYRRDDGTAYREMRLEQNTSALPYEIIDTAGDGRTVLMRAKLMKYKRIGTMGPLIPHHYEVEWPENQATMQLKIDSVRFKPTLPDWICEFPERWNGASECLDE